MWTMLLVSIGTPTLVFQGDKMRRHHVVQQRRDTIQLREHTEDVTDCHRHQLSLHRLAVGQCVPQIIDPI